MFTRGFASGFLLCASVYHFNCNGDYTILNYFNGDLFGANILNVTFMGRRIDEGF